MIFMKRIAVLSMFLTLGCCALAQPQRSFSVWDAGKSQDYPLYMVDSLSFLDDGSMRIYTLDGNDTLVVWNMDSITFAYPEIVSTNVRSDEDIKAEFKSVTIKSTNKIYKKFGKHNPLMGHKFGADPFAMVDGDRLYVYMTDDHLYDSNGNLIKEGYADIRNISIISSDDLVNWTDHGAQPIAGSKGPATWANNSWAPCAAHKKISGKEKYFLYFADNGSGIGVVRADSPWGPWELPQGMKQLISRSTANCGDVTWLFDPAVFMDTKSVGYLYFGGGVPDGKEADPGTARCVKLGTNMVSIVGTPQKINPPFLFEDSGINKIGGKYMYSYCANWTGNQESQGGPGAASIAYMISDNPLGPFTYVGKIFDNPVGASWAGGGGNNHHAIVEFQGKHYILYHTRTLKSAMSTDYPVLRQKKENGGAADAELRSTCMSEIQIDETTPGIKYLPASKITEDGVEQLKNFDPYRVVPGATMAWEADVTTEFHKGTTPNNTYCTAEMVPGSWMCISKPDFKRGAVGFTAQVKGSGAIKVCSKNPTKGRIYAWVDVPESKNYITVTVPLIIKPTGVVDDLYLVSSGNLSIKSWSFF